MNLYINRNPSDFIVEMIFKKMRALQTIAAFSGKTVTVAGLYRVQPDEMMRNRPRYLKRGRR